jgi:hypothetical protein
MYALHLQDSEKAEIISALKKYESPSPLRQGKAQISISKFEYMLTSSPPSIAEAQ